MIMTHWNFLRIAYACENTWKGVLKHKAFTILSSEPLHDAPPNNNTWGVIALVKERTHTASRATLFQEFYKPFKKYYKTEGSTYPFLGISSIF